MEIQDPKLDSSSQAFQSINTPETPLILSLVTRNKLTCSECGNKSKKDCSFQRCRTCCKNRGFDCPTHVKSTWIPASKRKERPLSDSTPNDSPRRLTTPRRKRPSTVKTPAPPSPPKVSPGVIPSVAIEPNLLPTELVAPTLLKSVRVTSLADGIFEFGYHAMVKVGGHVFKGVLYNSGTESSVPESSILNKKPTSPPVLPSTLTATPTPSPLSTFNAVNGSSQKSSTKLAYYHPEKSRAVRNNQAKSNQSLKKNQQELNQSQMFHSPQNLIPTNLNQSQDLSENQVQIFESNPNLVPNSVNIQSQELNGLQESENLQKMDQEHVSLDIDQNFQKLDNEDPGLNQSQVSSLIQPSGMSIVGSDTPQVASAQMET